MSGMKIRLLLLTLLSAAPAFALDLAKGQLVSQPTLSLPWTEHGRLSQVSGRSPLGLSQEAYVVPQRPGKNQVRYFDYHWRDHDFLSDDGSAGLRLYFYDREYAVARIAGGLIRESWRYLSDRFQYKPSFKVPYILYNTYREFLETNVFAVQEGVLGVTSPQDLRMSLPYAGEREFFKMVSTHEMTHQFQIQKMAERAASAGLESPIGQVPLWFTEGLAEYYAHNQQMDSETEMFLRDIINDANRSNSSFYPIDPRGLVAFDTPINQGVKSRPFLIDVQKGARITADLIERGVGYATVPRFPWSLVTPLLRVIPTSWLARGMPERDFAPPD